MTKSPKTWAWSGLAVTLLGGFSYWVFLDVPFIRNTAIPNVVLVLLGTAMALYGAVSKPGKSTLLAAGVSVFFAAGLIVPLFVLMKLPAAEAVAREMTIAPDFSLVNQSGQTVSLASARSGGPVLLVFYRGHW